MDRKDLLLARLDAIARALASSPDGLALIGLGSVGLETARIDAYSDLDFFAVVGRGAKARFVEDLEWLSRVKPIAYAYRNTADGHKVLFEDGVFCEFAVFELGELAAIPFAPGRLVWKRDGIDDAIAAPVLPLPAPAARDPAWLLGEALTSLYVGLGRFRRGEKLSGGRLVQVDAVDRVVELAATFEDGAAAARDPFAPLRRVERRLPALALRLPAFVQGYERTPESALAILEFLEARFAVAPAMASAIRALAR